ncbi:MAG: peptide-methionine (S)-S-oxide reductase MsrA [Saprospiraceae bacterium]|nr:peptide-methionine (S)-S-oxide reductase MsrA [Saprospiraceae bacterium]
MQEAYFGGGCFWCLEAVFQRLKGVQSVESGYMGGQIKNPSYKEICSGLTGHAEIVKITFDPSIISFKELLYVFFGTHNPTTLNRQGNDVGTQYRSVIFYTDEEQKLEAQNFMSNEAQQMWSDHIVTELSPLTDYYPAEKYHQDYYNNNPNQGYCNFIIRPKVEKLEAAFQNLLK